MYQRRAQPSVDVSLPSVWLLLFLFDGTVCVLVKNATLHRCVAGKYEVNALLSICFVQNVSVDLDL